MALRYHKSAWGFGGWLARMNSTVGRIYLVPNQHGYRYWTFWGGEFLIREKPYFGQGRTDLTITWKPGMRERINREYYWGAKEFKEKILNMDLTVEQTLQLLRFGLSCLFFLTAGSFVGAGFKLTHWKAPDFTGFVFIIQPPRHK